MCLILHEILQIWQFFLTHDKIQQHGKCDRDKRAEDILEYSFQSISFLAEQGIKLLVIACHTSCVTSFTALQKHFPFSIVSIAEAGIRKLIAQDKKDHLVFLATETTVSSGVYQQIIQTKLPNCKITAVACPLFVPLVEMGYINHPLITQSVVKEHLRPLKETKDPIDAVLLACTHYPLLRASIEQELDSCVPLIDPAKSCAKEVQRLLIENNLENNSLSSPKHQFYVSDNPLRFQTLGALFFPSPIEPIFCSQTYSLH